MERKLGILTGCERLLAVAMLVCLAAPAWAVTVIRDAETEAVIDQIATPIFSAARLDPDSIDIYILNDEKLNAFVAGGQNLFINTGLIMRATDPEELAGVIAHETGHIAGGHLSRGLQAQQNAGISTVAGMLLGAAAAVAGAPELGTAIMAGGATVGQRGLLKFSRTQEQAADQAAVTYLRSLQMSPEGLLDFFHVLDNQNLRISSDGSEYLRTHPLTRDRITFLEQQTAQSPYRDAKEDPALVTAYDRVVAKLDGFLSDPAKVIERRTSDSVADRYARAVAYYRQPDLPQALALVDGLIADYPKDPYFYELKGQILFENGRVEESIEPNRQALRNRPELGAAPLRPRPLTSGERRRQGPHRIGRLVARRRAGRASQRRRMAVPGHRRRPARQRGCRVHGAGRTGGPGRQPAGRRVVLAAGRAIHQARRSALVPPAGSDARGRGHRGTAAPAPLRRL